jgi:hypothetical protein
MRHIHWLCVLIAALLPVSIAAAQSLACEGLDGRVTLFDGSGTSVKYTNYLPGPFSPAGAVAAAEAEHSSGMSCETTCQPPAGCVPMVYSTYDTVTYISGPDEPGNWYTYSITNFYVFGYCTPC